jgi:transposase
MSTLPILNAKAAAVDVGSEQMHVSIAGEGPKVFGSTTGQLHALRDYLIEQGVDSVAMEATGVYWLCLYEVLEQAGLEVVMVHGQHVKNLPGRKTDMKDCQWQATLHAHGLLRGGFVPQEQIRRLQDYQRLRADHITMAATHQLHMQKALERMNIKFHDVISHLTGVSGLKVIRAILAGERNPVALLALCDPIIQKKKADRVRESLVGTWKPEHLFALRQALAAWEFYQGQIAECDRALEQVLKELTSEEPPPSTPSSSERRCGINAPKIEGLHGLLRRLCGGKEPTAVPGITDYTLLQLVSETGTDLAKNWKTEKHFTAWLGVAPGSRQSGKRRGNHKRSRNRAGRIFCVVARSVGRTVDKALGGFYRRLKSRRGGLVANVALARKLAQLYWRAMVHGLGYVEAGLKKYHDKVALTEQRWLQKLARKHGMILQPKIAVG